VLSLIDSFRKSAASTKEETVPVVIPRFPLARKSEPPPLPDPPQATDLAGKNWSVDSHARLKIFNVISTGEFNTILNEIGAEYELVQRRIQLSRQSVCIKALRIEPATAVLLWNTDALRLQELMFATETDDAVQIPDFQIAGNRISLEIVSATSEHPFFEFEIVEDTGSRFVRSHPDPFTPQDDILF
jgi:hypothetical protein